MGSWLVYIYAMLLLSPGMALSSIQHDDQQGERELFWLWSRYDPDDCTNMDLNKVMRVQKCMSRKNGRTCLANYFEALGTLQTAEGLDGNSLSNGTYWGQVKWYNGFRFLKLLINLAWKGMICGSNTCTITSPFGPGNDVGTISYEDPCPELDANPCLQIDFTSGSMPRSYYARKVPESQLEDGAVKFVSFVINEDGSDSDVNILTL
jgi:hypothetical protein